MAQTHAVLWPALVCAPRSPPCGVLPVLSFRSDPGSLVIAFVHRNGTVQQSIAKPCADGYTLGEHNRVYRTMDDIVSGNEAQLKVPLLAPSFGSTVPEFSARGRPSAPSTPTPGLGLMSPRTPGTAQSWTPVPSGGGPVGGRTGAGRARRGAGGGGPAGTGAGADCPYAPLPTAASLLAIKRAMRASETAQAATPAAAVPPGALGGLGTAGSAVPFLSPAPMASLSPSPGAPHGPPLQLVRPGSDAAINRQPSDMSSQGLGTPGVLAGGLGAVPVSGHSVSGHRGVGTGGRPSLFQEPVLPPLPDSDGSLDSPGASASTSASASASGLASTVHPHPYASAHSGVGGGLGVATGPTATAGVAGGLGVGARVAPPALPSHPGGSSGLMAPAISRCVPASEVAGTGVAPGGADSRLCTVCCSVEKNCAIVPCGHMFCRACVDKVSLCPICRTEKVAALNVFV